MADDTKMIPGGIAFGLPVMVSPIVPRDEVWLRTKDDLVRVCNLANGESEVASLRAEVERLTRESTYLTEFLDAGRQPGESNEAVVRRFVAEVASLRAEVERLTRERDEARAKIADVRRAAVEFQGSPWVWVRDCGDAMMCVLDRRGSP